MSRLQKLLLERGKEALLLVSKLSGDQLPSLRVKMAKSTTALRRAAGFTGFAPGLGQGASVVRALSATEFTRSGW